jgi:ATP-dependent helicase/nuclease subunit A
MAQARAQAIEAACDEYHRLLYVGLTRAADRLLVCGAKGVNKAPPGCWHDLVLSALQPLSEEGSDADGKIWHFHKGAPAATALSATREQIALPSWLTTNPQAALLMPPILRPSDAAPHKPRSIGTRDIRETARLRGTLAHRLLQSLPDITATRRKKVASEFLLRRGKKLAPAERATLLRQVLLLVENKDFAELFAPGSRAEVAIVGKADEATFVSGQVDRLAVTRDAILIGDFKTDRDPPRRIEDVPQAYVRQLALYRAVLQTIYPRRTVRAALIWTEVPELMELSAQTLDAALVRAHLRVRAP